MSATTVSGQAGTDQVSTHSNITTHSKRNAVIALTVIALSILSFFVGRVTAPSHLKSGAQVATHAQLSPANRAQIANDVAIGPVTAKLSPADRAIIAADSVTTAKTGPATTEQLSAANRAEISNDVAPLTETAPELSPANRAQIANDVAPVAPLNRANTASCIAGRPC